MEKGDQADTEICGKLHKIIPLITQLTMFSKVGHRLFNFFLHDIHMSSVSLSDYALNSESGV